MFIVGDFELKILISLFSIGLFGGLGHCGFMCGPFVLMQVNERLSKIEIKDLTYLTRLKGFALIPYHLGRITTYGALGVVSSFFGKNIRQIGDFNFIAAAFLFIGAFLIFDIFLKNFKINIFSLPKFSLGNSISMSFFSSFTNKLFRNPIGLKGFFLGLILGFIPCGLLYSALIIVASLDSLIIAMFGMLLFGAGTIPSLFLSGIIGHVFFNKFQFGLKFFVQFILLINIIALIIMGAHEIGLI